MMGLKEIQEMMAKQAKAAKEKPQSSGPTNTSVMFPPPPGSASGDGHSKTSETIGPIDVEGVALDAMLGAIIETDEGHGYYIEGHEWTDAERGKRFRVTGTHVRKALGPPTRNAAGELQHGSDGPHNVIANPSWQLV